jgi:hypothetical protein
MSEATATNRVAAKSKRRFAPAARDAPVSSVDRLLGACGVMIAGSSLAFAGYMFAHNDRPPRIAGMEYLSIFARPSHSLASTAPPGPPAAASEREEEAANERPAEAIDPTPTGSIGGTLASASAAQTVDATPTGSIGGATTVAGPPVKLALKPPRADVPKPAASRYAILEVSRGLALIANKAGVRRVGPGDVVPDLGRITAIERRGAHWVVLLQNGAPLEWPPRTALPTPPPAVDKKSSQR